MPQFVRCGKGLGITKHNETQCPTLGKRAQSKDGRSIKKGMCDRAAT